MQLQGIVHEEPGVGFPLASNVFVLANQGRETYLMVSPGDGKGPAAQWFPRFMRPAVNRWFLKMGWPRPYDENGDKIPPRLR